MSTKKMIKLLYFFSALCVVIIVNIFPLERKGGEEKHQCAIDIAIGCLPHML